MFIEQRSYENHWPVSHAGAQTRPGKTRFVLEKVIPDKKKRCSASVNPLLRSTTINVEVRAIIKIILNFIVPVQPAQKAFSFTFSTNLYL